MTRHPPAITRLLALAMLGASAGCATYPWLRHTRPLQPIPGDVAQYYQYTPIAVTATATPLGAEPSSRWQAQRVVLESQALPHSIRMDWYAPRQPGRHPLVLIFPIMAGDDLGTRDFAQAFASQGIHGIIVYRPKEKFSMEKPLSQLEEHFHTSVLSVRHAIDWLQTQPSVDAARIGSLGVSMGATLNVITASVEPRITRYVFCLPASHVAHLIMTTKDHSIAKKRREYLRRYQLTQETAETSLRELLRSEPLHVAGAIDPRRSLAIIAFGDRVIGWRNSMDIWRALGRPPTLWLPTGHYTSVFALPYVKLKVLWFFADWRGGHRAAPAAPSRDSVGTAAARRPSDPEPSPPRAPDTQR